MKALTWNVNGGLLRDYASVKLAHEQGRPLPPPVLDEERRERLLEVLLEERPDVVALQELTGWTLEMLKELGEEVGLPHARLFEAASGRHHQGLLSRTPLSVPRSLVEHLADEGLWWQTRTLYHGAFSAETRGLTVVTAHLAPTTAPERRREAEALTRVLPHERTLVLGDLSAVRREERTRQLDDEMPEDLSQHFAAPGEPSAVEVLLAAGFVDAGETSADGTALRRGKDGERSLLLRVDYALHTPGVEVRRLRVLDDARTRATSDHLPIALEVTL